MLPLGFQHGVLQPAYQVNFCLLLVLKILPRKTLTDFMTLAQSIVSQDESSSVLLLDFKSLVIMDI